MPSFLVDEDLPRSLAHDLVLAGNPSSHVHDTGLATRPDREIFDYATSKNLAIITRDVGFSRLHRLSHGAHPGILICGFHKTITMEAIKATILRAIAALDPRDLPGALFVISPGNVRRRRR
jgi:predicted nuclease of predicted toxin-antitoxin system